MRIQLVSKAGFPPLHPLPLLKKWFFWSLLWAGMLTYSRLHSLMASDPHSHPGGSPAPGQLAELPSCSRSTSPPWGCARRRPTRCQGSPVSSREWPQGSWSVQKDRFRCTGNNGCEHRALAASQGCGFVPFRTKIWKCSTMTTHAEWGVSTVDKRQFGGAGGLVYIYM